MQNFNSNYKTKTEIYFLYAVYIEIMFYLKYNISIKYGKGDGFNK